MHQNVTETRRINGFKKLLDKFMEEKLIDNYSVVSVLGSP